MKYLLSLVVGALLGAAIAMGLLAINPLFDPPAARESRSGDHELMLEIAGGDARVVFTSSTQFLGLGAMPSGAIAPDVVGARTMVSASLLSSPDKRKFAYVARLANLTAQGKPIAGSLIVNNALHVFVPGEGSFAVISKDDIGGLVRKSFLSTLFTGSWIGEVGSQTTVGPRGDKAQVIGLSGRYAGQRGSAVLQTTWYEISGRGEALSQRSVLGVDFDER